ncbi:MAG: 4Fe-4S dicluster domain-containing protein [Dehalococcoidia bacterium]
MDAHRELFLEIDYGWIIYILAVLSIAALAYAVYHRVQLWKLGQKDDSTANLGQKTRAFLYTGLIDGIIHRRIIRDFYPGIPHALIFWGALLLLFATAMDVVSHYIVEFLHGNTYLAISCLSDFGGAILLLGLIVMAFRRYAQRPDRLDSNFDDAITIGLVFIIVITGFIVEGLRMLVSEELFPALPIMEDWARWSFLGYGFAKAFEGGSHLIGWYQALWWFHSLLIIGAIFYIAFAIPKLSHIVASPLNVFYRSDRPKGALRPIELEEAETFGAAKIEDFTFKDLLDLDACTRCGRCQDNCPAYLSGKPLSPKKIIQDLKALMTEKDPGLFKSITAGEGSEEELKAIIGEVITEDELWACTTCRSCQEQCPAFIEPINKIIEMRRYQVLEAAQFPETAMGALKSVERRGHPWQGTMASRTDWAEDLGVKLISDDQDVEVLYWVGCTAALEDRNIKVAKAVAKVLKAAGVKFAILGSEETCCGEPARRMGNEYLFQIDVRPGEEYERGHIKEAISIPVEELADRMEELPKKSEIIAYCRGPLCVYADEAVSLLREKGFKAKRLKEGYPDWKAMGFPSELNQ